MATLIASAKLYQSTRCLLVDKNISAALTASFSLGNQRQPNYQGDLIQPVIVNGVPTVFANVLPFTPVKFVCDLYCEPSSISLTPQRITKQGGGNRVYSGEFVTAQQYVITTVGTTDWATIGGAGTYAVGTVFTAIQPGTFDYSTGRAQLYSWHTASSLRCVFPTYVRIDIEKLMDMGLGEGQDCVVQLEEGFLLEDKGVPKQASPFFEFADNVKDSPTPRNDNYVSFRTPKRFRSAVSSVFSLPANIVLRRKQLQSAVSSVSTLSAVAIFNPGKFAALFAGVSTILTSPVKTARYLYDFYNVPGIVFTMITNNTRLRVTQSAVSSQFTLPPIDFWYRRLGVSLMSSTATMNSNAIKNISISLSLSGVSTMTTSAVKNTNVIVPMVANNSVSAQINYNINSLVPIMSVVSTAELVTDVRFIIQTDLNATDYAGNVISPSLFFKIPLSTAPTSYQSYATDFTIEWGDGTSTQVTNVTNTNLYEHTYSQHGTYDVRIKLAPNKFLRGFSATDAYGEVSPGTWAPWYNKLKTFVSFGFKNFQAANINGLGQSYNTISGLFAFTPYTGLQVPEVLPPTIEAAYRLFYYSKSNPSNVIYWDWQKSSAQQIYVQGGTGNTIRNNYTNIGQMFVNAPNFNQPIYQYWNLFYLPRNSANKILIYAGSWNDYWDGEIFGNAFWTNGYNASDSVHKVSISLANTYQSKENFNKTLIRIATRVSASSPAFANNGNLQYNSELDPDTTSYPGLGSYSTGLSAKTFLLSRGWTFDGV